MKTSQLIKATGSQHTQRLSRSVFWAALGQYGKQVLAFGFSIVIARILSPEDFGLVAMIVFFTAFSRVLIDSGFSMTLIREKENALVYDTVFWTNLALAVGFAMLLFGTADWISRFYGEPRLVELVQISAGLLVVESLSIVQRSRLRKRLQFGKLAIIENVSLGAGYSVCLLMAWKGAGYWSLVGQQIAVTFSDLCMFFMLGYRPRLRFSYAALKPLLPYSSGLLGNKVANTFLDSIDVLMVGKLGGAELLGLYNRGNALMQIPIRSTTFIFARVLYSGFASIQEDKGTTRHLFSRLTALYAFLMPPIMLFLGLNAEAVATALYGDKWVGAAPFLSAFCVVGAIYPLVDLNKNMVLVQGFSGYILKLELLVKGASAVLMLAAIVYVGPVAAILVKAASMVVLYFAYMNKVEAVLGSLGSKFSSAWQRSMSGALAVLVGSVPQHFLALTPALSVILSGLAMTVLWMAFECFWRRDNMFLAILRLARLPRKAVGEGVA
jgi:O-antigen/teichoic acid export membrane protein